jgi:hypothetical protein
VLLAESAVYIYCFDGSSKMHTGFDPVGYVPVPSGVNAPEDGSIVNSESKLFACPRLRAVVFVM